MDQLEGTTLDLIYRRRVRSFYTGYTIIFMVLGMVVALPLVKVDVVTTSGGMVRSFEEPAELVAPMAGIVESSILKEHLAVKVGDTLVWMRRDLPETRIREYGELIRRNLAPVSDIISILNGKPPVRTGRYRQSFMNHTTALKHLQIEQDFLYREFTAAATLFQQEVIPVSEYELARSNYRVVCAKLENLEQSYRSGLEDELFRLQMENRLHRREIAKIKASLQGYFVTAPATGIIRQCPGIACGSVLQPGTRLGTISPEGTLVAECYVDTRDIQDIKQNMPVRIRFDGKSHRFGSILDSRVSQIDPDAVVLDGKPVYRIRCMLGNPCLVNGSGKSGPVIPGMTFSASMILYRTSLASLLLERINRWGNPALADQTTGTSHVPDP
jgi:multidrug resistance efflux pump